ncbi:P-loop containing nucleoside triphosphate hydrolase protein [Serendipita vermifera]|nr:P-loop containing nucleoside triphosphate hydrolase protein [Serendipita vermifera]
MSRPARSPARKQVSQKSITPEGLLLQGFTVLESLKPHSAIHADWQHLLERLEQLTLGASCGTAKQPYEVNGTSGEAALSLDVGSEDAPKRTVNWQSTTRSFHRSTSTADPPTMASDKGSTSSLSVPAYETDVPSPSYKFTFTRTHSNSFSVDLFPEESISQPSPTLVTSLSRPAFPPKKEPPPRHPARSRSETVPNMIPNMAPLGRSRSTSIRGLPPASFNSNLHGTSIDENSTQEVIIKPLRTPKSPSSVMQGRDLQGPPPVVQHPRMQPTHRHSRSLPVLRPVTKVSVPPPLPPLDLKRTNSKNVRHSLSYNELAEPSPLFLPGGFIPATKTPKLSNTQRRPEPRSPTRPDPQERWTIHDRDSWEVVPPVPPSKSPRHSSTHLPHASSSGEPTSPTGSSKPRGLGLLRRRLSKTQLSIKTGPRASISNLGSPGRPLPIPVNVNTVVMGPIGCGVSTLIQKFMASTNEWVPASTIDEFYHHVVKSDSRTVYYNITEVTGSEEYVDLRRAVLRRAQVVILCFRLDSRTQFRDAIVRLVEDIHTIGEIPIILVGTFQDITDREVTSDEAQTAAEALHASYFECSPLLSRGVNEIFNHAADILRNADEIRPPVATAMQPPSATKNLFNLVRNRRAYSTSSPRMKNQNHYVPHSASSKQQTFAEATTPVPVMNIAPNSPATNGNVLLLSPQHFKCVIMGGKSSGRKSLVHRYLHGTFEWLPEVPWMTWKAAVNVVPLENERRPSLPIIGSTVPYALTISETAPTRELDTLRKITYIGTSVFVICFSVSDHREEVMQEIQERWAEECRLYNPTIPIIVVATKVDQRAGTLRAWTQAQGEALSRSIRAAAYLECSAATGEGIETVFQTIIRVATDTHRV